MGFLDDFKKGFNQGFKVESVKSRQRIKNSDYQTEEQRKYSQYQNFNKKTDSELLNKVKNPNISEEDRKMMETILSNRGYIKKSNGIYDRVRKR